MLDDLVITEVQLILVVFGGDEHDRARLRHLADPVAADHGGDAQLLHQQRLADTALAGQQRHVLRRDPVLHLPAPLRRLDPIPAPDVDHHQ